MSEKKPLPSAEQSLYWMDWKLNDILGELREMNGKPREKPRKVSNTSNFNSEAPF